MSPANYSASLVGWAAKSATGVTLSVGPQYLAGAAAARSTLVERGWNITDGGPVPAAAPSVARSVVVSPGKKSVLVSWVAPLSNGGAPITGYLVKATPGGKTCPATAAQSSCTVTGLTNGKSYTFTVKATNAGSKSSTTASSLAVVAGAPTVAQTLKVTFPVTPHSAKVSWVAPKYINSGAVTGYRVRWCKVNTCSAWSNLPAIARSATITGRTKNVSYRFEVQAKNSSGYSPIASKVFKQAK
jgi:titin